MGELVVAVDFGLFWGRAMIRIMLLTFGVLGWAWFELSGGNEFVPGENGIKLTADVRPMRERLAEPRPVFVPRNVSEVLAPKPRVTSLSDPVAPQVKTVKPPVKVATPEPEAPEPEAPEPEAPEITAPVFAGTQIDTVEIDAPDVVGAGAGLTADSDNLAALLTEAIRNSAPPPPSEADIAGLGDGLELDAPVPQIAGLGGTLPLGVALDGTVVAEPVAQDVVDRRTVTGTRVNLRGGPATSFEVVTQLLQGVEVEVLDDTGDGWVRLRTVDDEFVGWMSEDFLQAAN
jgi:hypothetical protein